MEKLRFYTNNLGPSQENESRSLNKAIELAKELDSIDEITILIHTKSNTGYLERTIGRDKVPGLLKGEFVAFKNGPRIKLETKRTIQDDSKIRILLTYGLRSKELFEYDGFHSVQAIVAHQWKENDLKDWAEAWGAIEIISESKREVSENTLDPVVKNALDDLSYSINLSTGIIHPMDEELCKTYLRALHKYNYVLNEKEILSYLITKKGWESEHAKDVLKLISKLNSGGYFIGGAKTGLQNYIKN